MREDVLCDALVWFLIPTVRLKASSQYKRVAAWEHVSVPVMGAVSQVLGFEMNQHAAGGENLRVLKERESAEPGRVHKNAFIEPQDVFERLERARGTHGSALFKFIL